MIYFPVVEATGEVSSYGDYNENGNAGVNVAWPARQNYIFQCIKEYGEREVERGGLARINWVSEIDRAAALTIAKFLNLSYLFGIAGLQNYGIANDPNLSAALTPSTKAAGGVKWINNGVMNASANEVYSDFETMFQKLVIQTGGLIEPDADMRFLMSPGTSVAMTITNSFGVNVGDLLKNLPECRADHDPAVCRAVDPDAARRRRRRMGPAVGTQGRGSKDRLPGLQRKDARAPGRPGAVVLLAKGVSRDLGQRCPDACRRRPDGGCLKRDRGQGAGPVRRLFLAFLAVNHRQAVPA